MTSHTDPLGHKTDYSYDTSGNLLTTRQEMNGQVPDLVTNYTYVEPGSGSPLPVGTPLSVQDPDLNLTTYSYYTDTTKSSFGQFYQVVNAAQSLQQTTTYAYDPVTGNLTSATDPLGYATTYAYDNLNEVTQITQPSPGGTQAAPVWLFAYAGGKMHSATDPRTNTTTYGYDGRGRLQTVTQPATNWNGTGYYYPAIWTYTYDSFGQLTQLKNPDGQTTAYGYDVHGNELTETLPDPATGLPDSGSPIWTYTYDHLGNMLTSEDPNQNTTTYGYDSLLRLTTITAPSVAAGVAVTSMGYNNDDQVTQSTDPMSRVTQYGYDNAGRLTLVTDPLPGGSQAASTTAYTYDNNGNVLSTTIPSGTTSYQYDDLGRLIKTTQPTARRVKFPSPTRPLI